MKNLALLGWCLLNIQLIVGFTYSYDFLHRHIIINNVLPFILLVFIFSNLLFHILQFIKLYSLRAFIVIICSASLMAILIITVNEKGVALTKDNIINLVESLFILMLGSIFQLLLVITTPVTVVIELFARWKLKKL